MVTVIATKETPTRWQREAERDAYYQRQKERLAERWKKVEAEMARIEEEWEAMEQFHSTFRSGRPWEGKAK